MVYVTVLNKLALQFGIERSVRGMGAGGMLKLKRNTDKCQLLTVYVRAGLTYQTTKHINCPEFTNKVVIKR